MIFDAIDVWDAEELSGHDIMNQEIGQSHHLLTPVQHLSGCLEERSDSHYMAALTNGDGACAIHSAWGKILSYNGCMEYHGDLECLFASQLFPDSM
jgi:hypothetical protein